MKYRNLLFAALTAIFFCSSCIIVYEGSYSDSGDYYYDDDYYYENNTYYPETTVVNPPAPESTDYYTPQQSEPSGRPAHHVDNSGNSQPNYEPRTPNRSQTETPAVSNPNAARRW